MRIKKYKIIENYGRGQVILFIREAPGRYGLSITSVWCKKSPTNEFWSAETFASIGNPDKAIMEAKNWIKNNLFSVFHEKLLR